MPNIGGPSSMFPKRTVHTFAHDHFTSDFTARWEDWAQTTACSRQNPHFRQGDAFLKKVEPAI